MLTLSQDQVRALQAYVSQKIEQQGCDHSHRFSRAWAEQESINWNSLLDLLEAYGGYCDCEVTFNLPDEGDLILPVEPSGWTPTDAWKIPETFHFSAADVFDRIIVCRAGVGQNSHAADGEILVPAPADMKPVRRIRKSVHFFVGISSGLPAEVGVVQESEPQSAVEFSRRIIEAGLPALRRFTSREAAYTLSRISKLAPGTTVGTSFLEISGITGRREELRIHKVILRR